MRICETLKIFEVEDNRGVDLGNQVDFRSYVSGRFKIESCVHFGFYIIINTI